MAEYYAVLKKAVGGLGSASAESRRAVYDKARNALIGQLKAIDPPLAASDISRQRLELEEAIRRVEREATVAAQAALRQPPPEPAPEPARSTAHEPVPPPPLPEPVKASPQDIFRRAIQEAEARGSSTNFPVERQMARAPSQFENRDAGVDQREHQMPPARPPAPAPVPPLSMPEPHVEARSGGGLARLAPDYDNDWQPREAAPAQPAVPYDDRRDVPRQSGRKRRDYVDDDDGELLERSSRRSRLPTILLFVLIIGMIGGLGALAWSQRTVIADLLAGFDDGPAEVAAPVAVPEPPESTAGKSADRLGDIPATDPSVRVIGDSASGNAPPPPAATADPIADAIVSAPEASGNALVGQSALLYEEPLDAATAAAGVTAIDAVVTWSLTENGSSGPEITANIDVPDRGMKIRLVIRRNTDPTLPASHLVETVINTPPDFPGKGIRSVPRIVLKTSEDERGLPLVGAAAKVADGFFWIALSASAADVVQNLKLLQERSWMDLPLVYETGQRAILTFEKGTPGERVFEKAFAAWNAG